MIPSLLKAEVSASGIEERKTDIILFIREYDVNFFVIHKNNI